MNFNFTPKTLKGKRVKPAPKKPDVENSDENISGFDLHAMSFTQVAICMGTSVGALRNWVAKDGCPRNEKATLDLPKVIAWKIAKITSSFESDEADTEELKRQKLQQEIAKLKTTNEILQSKSISREDHERIFAAMGAYIKSTLESAIIANGAQFVGLNTLAEATGNLTLLVKYIFSKMKELSKE
jgi:hypothetical protein